MDPIADELIQALEKKRAWRVGKRTSATCNAQPETTRQDQQTPSVTPVAPTGNLNSKVQEDDAKSGTAASPVAEGQRQSTRFVEVWSTCKSWLYGLAISATIFLLATVLCCRLACTPYPVPPAPYPPHRMDVVLNLLGRTGGLKHIAAALASPALDPCDAAINAAIADTQSTVEGVIIRNEASGRRVLRNLLYYAATADVTSKEYDQKSVDALAAYVEDSKDMQGFIGSAEEQAGQLRHAVDQCWKISSLIARKIQDDARSGSRSGQEQTRTSSNTLGQQRSALQQINSTTGVIQEHLSNVRHRLFHLSEALIAIRMNAIKGDIMTEGLKDEVRQAFQDACLEPAKKQHFVDYYRRLESLGRSQCWRCSFCI